MKQITLNGLEIEIKAKKKRKKENFQKRLSDEQIIKKLIEYSRDIWSFNNAPRTKEAIEHGATFSPELIRRIMWIYSEEKDTVVDPFLGSGTTMKICKELKRNCIGFELNTKFYTQFIKPLLLQKEIIASGLKFQCYNEDCRNILNYIPPDSIQLILTSPPYASFIQKSLKDREKRKESAYKASHIHQYSHDEKDFGNLNYEAFLKEMSSLIESFYQILGIDGFLIFIVKDYRDMENGIGYIPFHNDLSTICVSKGFFYHDLIIEDQNEHRKLKLNGSKRLFYTNLNANFILVLRKIRK